MDLGPFHALVITGPRGLHVILIIVFSFPLDMRRVPCINNDCTIVTCDRSVVFPGRPGFYDTDVSHDIASSEKWCQCLDKKVQDFSVVKQNSNMRISK